jgi:hypothetical protein
MGQGVTTGGTTDAMVEVTEMREVWNVVRVVGRSVFETAAVIDGRAFVEMLVVIDGMLVLRMVSVMNVVTGSKTVLVEFWKVVMAEFLRSWVVEFKNR